VTGVVATTLPLQTAFILQVPLLIPVRLKLLEIVHIDESSLYKYNSVYNAFTGLIVYDTAEV